MTNARDVIEKYFDLIIKDPFVTLKEIGIGDWNLILFVTDCESLYDIRIPQKQLVYLETVSDLITLIDGELNGTH